MKGSLKNCILFLLCLLFCTTFFSCLNDSDSNDNGDKNLIGTWEWSETSGGFAGEMFSPESTGDTQHVVFEENGRVTFFKNDQIVSSCTYFIGTETSIFTNENVPVIEIEEEDGYSAAFVYFFPSPDQLIMNHNVFDGYSYTYTRQTEMQ